MKKMYFVLAVLAVVSVSAIADVDLRSVMVNAGFDDTTVPAWPTKIWTGFDSTTQGDVPGWNSGACNDSGLEAAGYGLYGTRGAFLMGTDGPMWQTSSAAIVSGETYKLAVAVKHAGLWPSPSGTYSSSEYAAALISLYAVDGTAMTDLVSINTGPIPAVVWGDWHWFTISYTADATYAGKLIGVKIDNVANDTNGTWNTWMGVDIPEPATLSLLGLGAAALLRKRK